MLKAKACHQGLRPRAQFFGLEVVDGFILLPLFYICGVLLGHLLLAVGLTGALAVVLRVIKWGRLPGYSSALVWFLLLEPFSVALGHDRAPAYPSRGARCRQPKVES